MHAALEVVASLCYISVRLSVIETEGVGCNLTLIKAAIPNQSKTGVPLRLIFRWLENWFCEKLCIIV